MATRALASTLEACRSDGKSKATPRLYDARELNGLPAPVQRYFRAVLKDVQPTIAAATIDVSSRFNLSPSGEQWKPFTSRQRVITRRPGFLWDARGSGSGGWCQFPGLQGPHQWALLGLMRLHASQDVVEHAHRIEDVRALVQHDALGPAAHGGVGDLGA